MWQTTEESSRFFGIRSESPSLLRKWQFFPRLLLDCRESRIEREEHFVILLAFAGRDLPQYVGEIVIHRQVVHLRQLHQAVEDR